MLPVAEREKMLKRVLDDLVDKYVHLGYNPQPPTMEDHVEGYANQILNLGYLFKNSIWEGDSLRVLWCYWYLLPLFKSADRS